MHIVVLQGSVRADRMGARVALWVTAELTKRGHTVTQMDAVALDLPLLDRMWKEVKQLPADAPSGQRALRDRLAPLAELIAHADGFIVCTAEYNHSVPPALSNMIDYFLEEWGYRPAGIVCYSATPFGGVRAAIQLRSLLGEVGLITISGIQPIPAVGNALSEDGHPLTAALAERSGRFFDEFDWYVEALRAQREKTGRL